MKKKVNGVWIDETPEDEAAIIESLKSLNTEQPAPTPTIEERVTSVEDATDALIMNLLFRQI